MDNWLCQLFLFPLCPSHRSSTRQRRGKCSKCLMRSTKSCTKGEAVKERSSRGCRMSVSNGPHASHIFGRSFDVSALLVLNDPLELWRSLIHAYLEKHFNAIHRFKGKKAFFIIVRLLVSRIIGTQLLSPTDEGFQWFATPGTRSAASSPSAGRKSSVKSQEKDKGGAE